MPRDGVLSLFLLTVTEFFVGLDLQVNYHLASLVRSATILRFLGYLARSLELGQLC